MAPTGDVDEIVVYISLCRRQRMRHPRAHQVELWLFLVLL